MNPFDFNLVVKRRVWNFEELTEEIIQKRLTRLTEYYEWVKKEGWVAQHHLFLSEDLRKKVLNALEEEIGYSNFYLEFQTRRQKEPNFNKWVFTPKEQVVKEYSHLEVHDQWTKTNGRIKATVEIDKSGKTTKISVQFRNDSEALRFIDDYLSSQPKIKASHVKNIQSINQKIKEYKQIADEFLNEHLFPQDNAEKQSFDILKKLLSVEERK